MGDKNQVNANFAFALHYLAAAALIGIYFYISIIAKMVPPDGLRDLLIAGLAGLGFYNAKGSIPNNPPPTVTSMRIVPNPEQKK